METFWAFAGLISLFAFFVFLFKYFKAKKENNPDKPASKYLKRVLICLAVLIVALIATPSKKETEKKEEASTGGTTEIATESENAAEVENEADTENEEHHIYDNAELIDMESDSDTEAPRQRSVIHAASTEVTDDALEDWYFNYIKKNEIENAVIIYTDRDGYGVGYSKPLSFVDSHIYKDTMLNEDYSMEFSGEEKIYIEQDDHLVFAEEETKEYIEAMTELQDEKGSGSETDKEESKEDANEVDPLENAKKMGQWWFSNINWDSVFKYKHTIHYLADYKCIEAPEEFSEYGKYVGIAGADLQNGFGAEFSSHVYIFMDENGVAQHVFYDEADGTSMELPMENITMNF